MADVDIKAEATFESFCRAIRVLGDLGRWEDAVLLAKRTLSQCPNDRKLAREIAHLFEMWGRFDEALACWTTLAECSPKLWVRLGIVQTLERAGEPHRVITEAVRALAGASGLSELPPEEQKAAVAIVRWLVRAQSLTQQTIDHRVLTAALEVRNRPSGLLSWISSMLSLANGDKAAALAHLDGGLRLPAVTDGVALDLHAEKALVLGRYYLFGEALAEWRQSSESTRSRSPYYARRSGVVEQVAALCPDAPQPLRYPECLIDALFLEMAASPYVYPPRPGHVAMISGSLGPGGGERQTITVTRRLIKDARIRKLSLLVRSVHLRASDDFFLPTVQQWPIDVTVYGENWETRTPVLERVPEFHDRPRLVEVIELLPHNVREEVLRLCRLLIDQRPQAVHIWQDIYPAALACALVGTPRFFIHRGSLAPDYWGQTEYQTAVHFRPMRHAYRRLLERPDFVILNNSLSGCRTDQAWTGWVDPKPFQILYNAIDFELLGPNCGRNRELRESLGIAEDAPVIGGSFRIVPVKRPLWWIEAAYNIRQAIPDAQFLIIGDGELTEAVASFASQRGFRNALHLPGRVTNVGDWYRAMDLMLMTSEREGIPNSIIEAQHFGVPIVAPNVGGIAEALEEGRTGHVIPADEGPAGYSGKAIEVLKNPQWQQCARLRAPEFVHTKFSLGTVLDRLVRYYGI